MASMRVNACLRESKCLLTMSLNLAMLAKNLLKIVCASNVLTAKKFCSRLSRDVFNWSRFLSTVRQRLLEEDTLSLQVCCN